MAKYTLKQTAEEIQNILNGSPWIVTKEDFASFDIPGKGNKIYIDNATNTIYRWSTSEEEYIPIASYPYSPGAKSFFVGGNYDPLILRNFDINGKSVSIPTNDPLSKILIDNNIKYGVGNSAKGAGVEYALYIPLGSTGLNATTGSFFDALDAAYANGKHFLKIEALVYSKKGLFPPATSAPNHLGLNLSVTNDNKIIRLTQQATYEKLNDHVIKMTAIADISHLFPHQQWGGTGGVNMFSCAIISSVNTNGMEANEMIISGFKATCFNTLELANKTSILGDWEIKKPTSFVTSEDLQKEIDNLKAEIGNGDNTSLTFNDINYNRAKLSNFINKWQNKIVDSYNELTVNLTGDSIMGRQDNDSEIRKPENYTDGKFTSKFKPQMAFTPDMNNPQESKFGYETGHVAPNMWEQLVGYRLLKRLQYKDADIKYFRHDSAEVSVKGRWRKNFPSGADCVNHISSNAINDSIELNLPAGMTFAKFIYSTYGQNSNTTFKVEIWDSETSAYRTCQENNITYSHPDTGTNSMFQTLSKHKWAQVNFKGFDPAKTYKIKISNTKAQQLTAWGFEAWSKPHINLNITAEGGSTVPAHINNNGMNNAFYSENYKNSLLIYELPFYNDFGTGSVTYKGDITSLTQMPDSSATDKTLYRSKVTGVLTNFNNIQVKTDDYISYDGKVWKVGLGKFETTLKTYLQNLNERLYRLKACGTDVLCVMPHNAGFTLGRPFQVGIAYQAIRDMVASYGFAIIDTLIYQLQHNIFNVVADGVHLNDVGSKLYEDIIWPIFDFEMDKKYPFIYATPAVHAENIITPYIYKPSGQISNGTVITFPTAFIETPFVSLSTSTPNVSVTDLTPSSLKIVSSGNVENLTLKLEIPYNQRILQPGNN